MTIQNKNVPTLRFTEFNGNLERSKLGEVATFTKGKGISKFDIDEKVSLNALDMENFTHIMVKQSKI